MQVTTHRITRKASVLLVLLACFATSCATYRNIAMTRVPTVIKPNDGVRVTTMEGEEFEFRVEAVDLESISSPERAFPYKELVMVERSEIDVVRSLFAYMLVGLTLFLI